MQKLTIIKVGGKLLDDPLLLEKALQSFSQIDGHKILVHGGGKKSGEVGEQLGITPKMIDGKRVTDNRTLEIVVMVYAGLLNKTVVGQLQSFGCDAIGLSGADGNSILAKKRKIGPLNLGYAGDIKKVYTPFIESLLEDGLAPVFCAITHNGKGQLLNTNSDTIATSLACAMAETYEVTLKYCIDKEGVLEDINDEESVLAELDANTYKKLKKGDSIPAALKPNIDYAFKAKKAKVAAVFICGIESIAESSAIKGTEIR